MDQAAVQQMVSQMLAHQVAQLQQQHAQQLQQALANFAPPAAAAAPAAAPHTPGPRLPPPAVFEGASAKLDEFIADVEQQVAWYTLPAAEVTRFAAGFMRGAARDWWVALQAPPADWAGMTVALRARFQPINSADTARAKLLALSQGKRPINDYIDDYRRLIVRVPSMSADDRFFQFRRGLRPAIAMQLDMQGITTLDLAITRAAQIGGRLEGAAQQAASSSSNNSNHHAPMDLDAMDSVDGLERDTAADDAPITRSEMKLMLAAMQDKRCQGGSSSSSSGGGNRGNRNVRFAAGQSRLPTIPHLSPEQVKEYMDADKCFGCGSKEHRSRGCPKRKVGADGRVSWSN
jgi:hypothetical protein